MSRLGTRNVARSIGLAVAVGWLGAAGVVRPVAAVAAPIACPDPAGITVRALLDLQDEGGPLAEQFPFLDPNERGLACFGAKPFRFVAFLGQPEGLGGAFTYWIRPEWLDYQLGKARWLTPTDEEIAPGFSAGPFLQVAVEPDLLATFDALELQWVFVTARFDHPAARDCEVKEDLQPGPDRPKPEELVEVCRGRLVVTGVEPADAPSVEPPPAATSSPAATATPLATPTPEPTPSPAPSVASPTGPSPTGPSPTATALAVPPIASPTASPLGVVTADPASSSGGPPWLLATGLAAALAAGLAVTGIVARRRWASPSGPAG